MKTALMVKNGRKLEPKSREIIQKFLFVQSYQNYIKLRPRRASADGKPDGTAWVTRWAISPVNHILFILFISRKPWHYPAMREENDGPAIARQRIAQEASERTGILDLGRLGLTELPEDLFRLKHLRRLNLGSWIVDEDGEGLESSADISSCSNSSVAVLAIKPRVLLKFSASSRGLALTFGDRVLEFAARCSHSSMPAHIV